MKRCPTCNKTFTDQNLSFCIDDGTPLLTVEDTPDEITVVAPSASAAPSNVPAYQPPPPHSSTPAPTRRKTWPWVVGILGLVLIVFVGLGIAAVVLIPRMISGLSNANSHTNTNRPIVVPSGNANENTNSNANISEDNTNTSIDETPAPTDEAVVLSTLTDLEQEWTVANINADKKKLDQILADDYVGTDASGETQGKAEYLRTIERDTTIQKWEFEDLDVTLSGNRASLTGIIRLQVSDKPVAYRFTDKFVWRDGRWQATGSQVTPVK